MKQSGKTLEQVFTENILKMNTRKHTTRIRLASLALAAFDCWLLSRYPSLETALAIWLPFSMALVLAIASIPSRFKA
jgi:hypothetical protein